MENIPREMRKTEDTWKLEDIFGSNDMWEEAFRRAARAVPDLKRFEGRLSQMDVLEAACRETFALERELEALFAYARMRRDEDNGVSLYQGMADRAQTLFTDFGTAASFIAPELLSHKEEYLEEAMHAPALSDYRMFLDGIIRRRAHTLSKEEERVVAMAGEMGASPSTIYDMLTDADLKFPKISGEDGEEVELTHANYIPLMMSRDRNVRKGAFEALYGTYASFSAAIPAIYAASVKSDMFSARTGKFVTCLEAALYPDNIDLSVYKNLISAVHNHLPGLNRYLTINARALGLSEMHMYDVYAPATKGFDINISFDKAYDLVVDCLKVLGEDYQEVLRRAKDERWIDPYPNVGKSSGAYSWGTYDSHPYVLLNYAETLDGLQTVAHEMGHSMHTFYSAKAQPFPLAEYSLFVAEVASTVNEVLVLMELLERYPEKDAQAYLLNNLLDSYRTTLFRQTQFAEFEMRSHEMAEGGEPLNADTLNREYGAINALYYHSLVQDEEIRCEWMRIPHFYRAFYVYKYATGFSAAMALASKIRREGAPAVEAYKKFLSAGCSLYPIEALKLAGIDMSKPEPVEEALAMFEQLVERYEKVME